MISFFKMSAGGYLSCECPVLNYYNKLNEQEKQVHDLVTDLERSYILKEQIFLK